MNERDRVELALLVVMGVIVAISAFIILAGPVR